MNLHQSADYIHTSRQIVHRVQEEVNRALIEGKPGHYDESELIEDYSCFLLTKGRMPRDWVTQHQVWRRLDDKLVLGGQWPTMSADVIDAEIWGEHAFQARPEEGQEKVAQDEEGAEDCTSSPFFVTISRHSSEGSTRQAAAAPSLGRATKWSTSARSRREWPMQSARRANEQMGAAWRTTHRAPQALRRPRTWRLAQLWRKMSLLAEAQIGVSFEQNRPTERALIQFAKLLLTAFWTVLNCAVECTGFTRISLSSPVARFSDLVLPIALAQNLSKLDLFYGEAFTPYAQRQELSFIRNIHFDLV